MRVMHIKTVVSRGTNGASAVKLNIFFHISGGLGNIFPDLENSFFGNRNFST